MGDELICCIDMFAAYQTVVTPTGDKIIVPEDSLTESIMNYCLNSGIYIIHYFGNEQYIKGKLDIPATYANNNIIVKVN